MIVFIDNYDSFTYNLVHYLEILGQNVCVFRNDLVSVAQLAALDPRAMVISPGPGDPSDAGVSCDVIRTFSGRIPILGVCLGHQCIAQVFGARIVQSSTPTHGKTSAVLHDGQFLFSGLPDSFAATRYHSLIVAPDTLPDCLIKTAWMSDGTIMGLRHKSQTVSGVQFHPEAILTEHGMKLLQNFLSINGGCW